MGQSYRLLTLNPKPYTRVCLFVVLFVAAGARVPAYAAAGDQYAQGVAGRRGQRPPREFDAQEGTGQEVDQELRRADVRVCACCVCVSCVCVICVCHGGCQHLYVHMSAREGVSE